MTIEEMTYLVPHQANLRIMHNVAKTLGITSNQCLQNIEELGNTGSVSSALVYAQNAHRYKQGDVIVLTVFGGGYSTGGCLIVA